MSKHIIIHDSHIIEKFFQEKFSDNIKIALKLSLDNDRTTHIQSTDCTLNCWALIRRGLNGSFDQEYAPLAALNQQIEESFYDCKHVALNMMDRIDPLNNLVYEKRLKLFRYLLSFWINYLKKHVIDLVVFKTSPHEIVDYILFEVAKRYNVHTVVFINGYYNGIFFVSDDYRQKYRLINYKNPSFAGIPPFIKDRTRLISSSYEDAEPIYKKIRRANSVKSRKAVYFLPIVVKFLYTSFRFDFDVYRKYQDIDKYVRNKIIRIEYALSKKIYSKLSQKFERPSRYFYFALNYQPENTTSPLGGYFVDQYMAVALLSKFIPSDCCLLVKEHPSQYLGDSYAHVSRNPNYYEPFRSLQNVRFVPFDADHFELVDNAIGTATVNGSLGWESVVRGKPTIVFGEAWYQTSPGTFRVFDSDTCEAAVTKILEGFSVDQKIVNAWLNDFLSNCTNEMYFSDEEASGVGQTFSPKKTREELKGVFNFFLNKYWPEEFPLSNS
jgi:hypothetical protein